AGQALWLRHRGVGPGDRVALMLRNGEPALSLMLAIAYASAIWVPVHTGAVGDNLAYVLTHAEPRIVVAEPDLLPAVAACGASPNLLTICPAEIFWGRLPAGGCGVGGLAGSRRTGAGCRRLVLAASRHA